MLCSREKSVRPGGREAAESSVCSGCSGRGSQVLSKHLVLERFYYLMLFSSGPGD